MWKDSQWCERQWKKNVSNEGCNKMHFQWETADIFKAVRVRCAGSGLIFFLWPRAPYNISFLSPLCGGTLKTSLITFFSEFGFGERNGSRALWANVSCALWCFSSWVGQNPPCSQVLQSAGKSSQSSGDFCGGRLMLIGSEWNLRKSPRQLGRWAVRTVLTNLFSTQVTSALENVLICLSHDLQSSSSTGGNRRISLKFSCKWFCCCEKWLLVWQLWWLFFFLVCTSVLRPSEWDKQELIFTWSGKKRRRTMPARRSTAPLRHWVREPLQQQNGILISGIRERLC